MQVRQSSFSGNRPPCPIRPRHSVHRHGDYERFADCNHQQREVIFRFPCSAGAPSVFCSTTACPYRPISVPQVLQDFDARANGAASPPATEYEKGHLARAWRSFVGRVNVLTEVLGQMIRVVKPNAASLWKQLRQQGNLPAILLRLARPFDTSLLKDYKCLHNLGRCLPGTKGQLNPKPGGPSSGLLRRVLRPTHPYIW